jgi:hypothetical protein
MTGLLRRATLFTALGLLAAGAALASVPNASNSDIGVSITIAGREGDGTVDRMTQKSFTIRDGAGNPVANSVVIINFTNCTSQDMRLCDTQPHAGLTVNCGAKTVSATTNSSGVATFRIVGWAVNLTGSGSSAGAGQGCATITADGVPMGSLTVSSPDQDGNGAVGLGDFILFVNDRFSCTGVGTCTGSGNGRGRSDFDGDGSVALADLIAFVNYRFGCAGGPGSCTGSSYSVLPCSGASCP